MSKKNTKVSLNIPKKSHSALIGRGGSTVKSLQEDFNVRINIPRKEDTSSIITISGDESDVEACQKEIEHMLGFKVGNQSFIKIVIDVPKNKHGMILGSGGSNIRNLESNTGCSIIIPGRNDESSLITIEGTAENAEDCKKEIEKLISMKVKVVSSKEEKDEKILKKIDLSQPINDALFFPDTDTSDGWNYDFFLQYLALPKKTMEVCVFTITDDKVADIIIENHKRGVKVRVITDNDTSVEKGSDIATIKSAGIPVRMDNTPYHMHNKFCVIDGQLLLNGSYNWTSTASTKNNENIIATNNENLVRQFSKYFEELWVKFANN